MKKLSLKRQIKRAFTNPVTVKELRGRMRGKRAFIVVTIYLLFLTTLITLAYGSILATGRSYAGSNARAEDAGNAVFTMVLIAQTILVVIVAPIFTTGAISGEKERQTFELLRTTLLPANRLASGKLLSGLGYVLLLVFASVPLQSIAFMLGGVAVDELLMTQIVLLISAVTYALLGLLFSTIMRSTLAATIISLAVAIGSILISPIFFIMNDIFSWGFNFSYDGELFLSITNLPFSLINVINSYGSFSRLGAFLGYVAFYAGISIYLYLFTIRRIKRVSE